MLGRRLFDGSVDEVGLLKARSLSLTELACVPLTFRWVGLLSGAGLSSETNFPFRKTRFLGFGSSRVSFSSTVVSTTPTFFFTVFLVGLFRGILGRTSFFLRGLLGMSSSVSSDTSDSRSEDELSNRLKDSSSLSEEFSDEDLRSAFDFLFFCELIVVLEDVPLIVLESVELFVTPFRLGTTGDLSTAAVGDFSCTFMRMP